MADRRLFLSGAARLGSAALTAWIAPSAQAQAPAQPAPASAPPGSGPAALTARADTSSHTLPTHRPVPGGVWIQPLGPAAVAPEAQLAGQPVLVWSDGSGWTAVVGLALSTAPGPLKLDVRAPARQAPQSHVISVQAARYAEQRLRVPPRQVTLSPDDLARHERERQHLATVMATRSAGRPERLRMLVPVPGPRSSSFGLRRVFNGQARSPHNGMDIAAPVGTPITSPLAGRVIDTGDYFFSGRSVWLDHGSGLLTFYCHLDRIGCATGQVLGPGEALGTVGATGRVTGPHLHWSVMLNRAYVDPALFIDT